MKIKKCPNCNATLKENDTSCPYCSTEITKPTQEAQVITNNIFMLTNNDEKVGAKLVDTKNINPRPTINFFYLTLGLLCGIIPGIVYLVVKNKQKKQWEQSHKDYVNKFKE